MPSTNPMLIFSGETPVAWCYFDVGNSVSYYTCAYNEATDPWQNEPLPDEPIYVYDPDELAA